MAGPALGATLSRPQHTDKTEGTNMEMRWCGRGLPRKPVAEGWYLVHNDVTPAKPLGLRGFRAWIQDSEDDLVECSCDFGGCRNAEVNRHYRVRRGP